MGSGEIYGADPSAIDPAAYGHPVRVACVGDSTTQGNGAPKELCYPSQLAALLGAQWQVHNFGSGGRTLQRGDYSWWDGPRNDAERFQPDVVVIMLGANDTKPKYWKGTEPFARDCAALVAEFASLTCKPRIYLCRPCWVAPPGNFGINEEAVSQEITVIDRVAVERGVDIVDVHGATRDRPLLFADRVHPNADGYAVVAATIYRALVGHNAPGKDLPAPTGPGAK